MDSNNYSIKLGIKLDEKSVANIKTDLNEKFKDAKISLKFDDSSLDKIKEGTDKISSSLQNISDNKGMDSLDKSSKQAKDGIDKLSGSVEKAEGKIKNANFATSNWAYNWSKAMQSFLTYNTVTQFYNEVVSGIKDMISQVKELDDSLVELQKVTDLEGESLKKFTDDAYAAGETVAKTGTEMIDAATSFAKAGYKDNALELGTVAAMYTNIADEEIKASDAADMIIAQMKAFNIEAKDSEHIIDAINEVSNNFAVSSSDIATNLGKASAVVANAGNSMEQYIGMVTAATEVTRNASKAANGLKTITLRLQGMNDEGEKDLELQAQMEGLFQKLGVSVYEANGELKNTYDILATLAPVYKELTNAEKAYVTETIAGKYQAQNAAAILNNWETAVNATTTALNSNGSAAAENEKVLNSIQGKLQQLSSEWEKLSKNIFESNLIKLFIDLGTTILKVANSDVGQFVIKAGALITIFGVLSRISIVQTINSFLKLIPILGLSTTSTVAYTVAMENLNKTTVGRVIVGFVLYIQKLMLVASTQGAAAASAYALKGALDLIAAHPVLATFAAIAGAAKLFSGEVEALREEIGTLKEELDGLDNSSTRIGEIKEEFNKENLSLDEQKSLFKEIKDIQKNLREEYGLNTKAINENTKELDKQLDKLKEIVDLQSQKKNQKLLEDTEAVGAGKNFWEFILDPSGYFDGFTESGKAKIKKQVEEYYDDIVKYAINGNKKIKDAFNELEAAAGDENITQDVFNKYFSSTYKAITDSKYSDEVKGALIAHLNEIKNSYDEVLQDTFDENAVKRALEGNFKGIKNILIDGQDTDLGDGIKVHIASALENGLDSDWFKEQIKKIADKNGFADIHLLEELMPELGDNANIMSSLASMSDALGIPLESLLNILIEIFPQLASVSDMTQITRTSFEELSTALDDVQDAYNTVCDALEEYNENGFFSIDTLQSLLEMNSEYLDTLVDENGNIRDNTDAFQGLAEAKLANVQADEDARYYNELLRLAQLDEAGAAQLAAGSIEQHNAAMGGQAPNAEKLRAQIQANIEKFNEESAAALKAAYDVNEATHKRNTAIIDATKLGLQKNFGSAMNRSSNSRSGSKSRGGSGSSSKSEKEWWEKEYDALKNQFDYNEITIEQYIGSLENLLGRVGQGTEAWRKINKELQKQKLDKVKNDYDAGRISLDQYIISLQNLQQAYAAGTEGWNKLADAIKKAKLDKLKEQQNDLKSALSAVNDVLDKQIDKYEEAKDAADKKYDDEIDKLEELQDKLDDQDDEYQRAQQAVSDFLSEQMSSIEEQRDSIENYYDTVIDAIEKMNEEQEKSLELAEAYEALMNAMTQKTKKVYKEGLGWVWTTDAEAIRDAKKTYEDLLESATTKEIEDQKNATINSLEEQITALQDYIDSWDKVFDKFDNEKNRNLADILLGDNWTEMVSQLDPQIVDDFSDAYYELQKNLEETEKQIEELNKQKEEEDEYWDKLIDDLKNYKDEWSDIADVYEEAQNALKARQIMGANWEKEILDKRLDVLENFKNKYNAILAEIDKVDNMSTNEASGYTALRLPGYANGGEVDYTGLAVLHGTPNKPEYVLNNSQMRNLLSNLTRPQTVSAFGNVGGSVTNNYSFGNIELPNVTNARQFANELKSLLNITKNQ